MNTQKNLGKYTCYEDLRFKAFGKLLHIALVKEYEYGFKYATRRVSSEQKLEDTIHLSVSDLLNYPLAYWHKRNMLYPMISLSAASIRGAAIHRGIEEIIYNAREYYTIRNKYGLLDIRVEAGKTRELRVKSRRNNNMEYNVVLHGRADIWLVKLTSNNDKPLAYIIDIKTTSRGTPQDIRDKYKKQVGLYMNMFSSIEQELRGLLVYVTPDKVDHEQVESAVSDEELIKMIQRIIEPAIEDIDKSRCNSYACDYASVCPIAQWKKSSSTSNK